MSVDMVHGAPSPLKGLQRIGIMGGTFDPIHYGHLLAAEEAFSSLGLDRVIFVPTGESPHKRHRQVSTAEDRYAMALLATLDNFHFSLSRVEIDRGGASHTVDTLREMRHWFSPYHAEIFFITGMDAVLQLDTWKNPELLPGLCHIVAVGRPGFDASDLLNLSSSLTKSIIFLEIPLLAISSTEIRSRIAAKKSIRYLVPSTVENYIHKKKLYGYAGA
jgi:nicotinate-nucleotide adenylyltransferase